MHSVTSGGNGIITTVFTLADKVAAFTANWNYGAGNGKWDFSHLSNNSRNFEGNCPRAFLLLVSA